MSFEGYVIRLCQNGHQDSVGCYDDSSGNCCTICGTKICWSYTVDQTNDDGVKPVLVQHTPAEYEECPCCKNKKLVKEETFCIPKNGGYKTNYKPNVPECYIKFSVWEYPNTVKEYDTEEEAWRNR